MNEDNSPVISTVNLEVPFADQPSVKAFLDAPYQFSDSEADEPIAEALLDRLLLLSKKAIAQELANSHKGDTLKELNIGYELWCVPKKVSEEQKSIPTEKIRTRWLTAMFDEASSQQDDHSLSFDFLLYLRTRIGEVLYQHSRSEILQNRALNPCIYGQVTSANHMLEAGSARQLFSLQSCGCDAVNFTWDKKSKHCNVPCPQKIPPS